MTMKKIPLYEASPAQLRFFASTILGLDGIKPQHKAQDIIAKILSAQPDLTEIDAEDETPAAPTVAEKIAKSAAAATSDADDGKSDLERLLEMADTGDDETGADRFDLDPRVTVTFAKASDATKPQTVQIAVNGAAFAYKRGIAHKVPYRVFLAALDAVETVGRETEEISASGLPVMEFSDQPSYPMESIWLPPLGELVQWHREDGSRPHPRVIEIASQMQRAA